MHVTEERWRDNRHRDFDGVAPPECRDVWYVRSASLFIIQLKQLTIVNTAQRMMASDGHFKNERVEHEYNLNRCRYALL